MWNPSKTFQDLVDEMGLSAIFAGTEVDEVTQYALLEWLFDYPLCDEDSKFLRYFRRKLNNVYPMYQQRLRVSSIKGNMDPFIVDFIERLRADSSTLEGEKSTTKSGTGSITDAGSQSTTISDRMDRNLSASGTSSETRTPNLTMHDVITEENTTDTTTDNTNTETRALNTDTDATTTETHNLTNTTDSTTLETRDLATSSDITVDVDGKTRSYNVAYPEANLETSSSSGIPSSDAFYPASLDYVQGETDVLSESSTTTNDDRTDTGTVQSDVDSTVRDTGTLTTVVDSETDETGTVTTVLDGETHAEEDKSKTADHTETGTETTAGTTSETQTGYETTARTGSVTDSRTRDSETEETVEGTESSTRSGRTEEVYQGRHESVVDILPRAISAIVSTNDLKWLVDQCLTCFDCYCPM